jgi:hypothetical protein
MAPSRDGGFSITLTLPASLAPLSLAFVVALPPAPPAEGARPGRTKYVAPLQGAHFTALIGAAPGSPTPLGPSLARPAGARAAGKRGGGKAAADAGAGEAVNFAVRCRGGQVSLVLLRPPAAGRGGEWGQMELTLDAGVNRTGDTWHVALPALTGLDTLCYGWRVDGDVSWESGHRVQPDQLMLDPAAPALALLPPSPPPPRALPALHSGGGGGGGGAPALAASSLASLAPGYAAAAAGVSAPLHRPLESLRALEVDVRTFSAGAAGVAHPGTFLGVAERLDHIRAVGVNCVILTPSYATAQGVGLLGRATVSFLAPDPALSTSPADPAAAAAALRAMVAALHAAGVEVLPSLDVAFTAEGTDAAPAALSLRGLDHSAYFRANGVLNCGSPAVGGLLTAAMRRWARDFGVDGFCLLNAENLAQDADGSVTDAPALAEALAADPVLAGLKLLAAPSDEALLPRQGARGFPHWGLWQQRNAAFPRDLTAFVAEGTPGMLAAVARRLTGSADVFGALLEGGMPGNLAAGRRPAFSFNSVSSLGRPPLPAVAEGVAGAAAAAAAAAGAPAPPPELAATVAKSLLAAVVLSQGTPVVSQEVTADVEVARFVGVLMRLRRRLARLLLPPSFDAPRDLTWHGAAGGEPDWEGAAAGAGDSNYLALCARHAADGSAVYFGLNPHLHAVAAALPPPPEGHAWLRAADTALPAPHDAALDECVAVEGSSYLVAPKAAVVLVAGVVERL